MTGRLVAQTAVVTGAGRGLGRAVAVALAREGATVWICARTAVELDRTAEHICAAGGKTKSRQVDLADTVACERFVDEVLATTGPLDVLINNAGILRLTPIEELRPPEWSQVLAVNLTAPYLLTRGFLPDMKRRGGSVVNVSSRAGVTGFKDEAAYCASKFGLEGLTRALALELEGAPVSVNTVTPGLRIKPTSMSEQDLETLLPEQREAWQDPNVLTPAFVLLAGLRGQVSGRRFDAYRLSEAIRREGFDGPRSRLEEMTE